MVVMEMIAEQVVLVDQADREVGLMEKLEAHQKGLLHRAFSIFLLDAEGKLILQRRALHKYHSGGLWTNTCCSHPRPDESTEAAASRRLQEEMGIACDLTPAFAFLYREEVGELVEHELDHVFVGQFDGVPAINPMEVADWKAVSLDTLSEDIAAHPEAYTVWLRLCLPRLRSFLAGDLPVASAEIPYIR